MVNIRGREAWAVPPVAGSDGSALRAGEGVPGSGFVPADADDAVGVLGNEVVSRLFSAGLDLNFALTLVRDGPAAERLWHAVDEIDAAIADLRRFLFSVPGALPEGGSGGGHVADDEPETGS